MKYAINHRDDFRSYRRAFFIGFMQFTGGLGAEVSCCYFLSTQVNTIDTLTKFISLAFISKVDDFYAASLTMAHPLKQPCKPLMITVHRGDPATIDMPLPAKIMRITYKTLRILYCSFLYYFLPFLAVFFSYFNPSPIGQFVTCY